MSKFAADLPQILEAYSRVSAHANVTPVVTSRLMNDLTDLELVFKCENMQRSGSFKFRGAINSVVQLTDKQKAAGVTTHSSGNHAQALALAAKCVGIKATVVVPNNAPKVKQDAIQGYGATIVLCEPTTQAREAACTEIINSQGATFVHPSNEPTMIAGHASLAVELLQQIGAFPSTVSVSPTVALSENKRAHFPEGLDAIVVPIGGGGLISGVALAIKYLSPNTRIIAAEPECANDASRSKAAGELLQHDKPSVRSVADGLLTTLGSHTWPVVRDVVDAVLTVSEDEIKEATKLVMSRMKLVIEPSAGTGVAVCLAERHRNALVGGVTGRKARVGVVLCGGNADICVVGW